MYRVVLDPIVMLRGLLNPHSICGCLFFDYADRYRAFFSDATVSALHLLIYNPFVVMALTHLTKTNPRQVERLLLRAERVRIPKDLRGNIFVAVALTAHADYVICEDAVIRAKCKERAVPVLTASEFVSLLAPEHFSEPEPAVGVGGSQP